MAKSNKERKELKEKAKIEEEKRKKKKFRIAKLTLAGVYVLSLVGAIMCHWDDEESFVPLIAFILFGIPSFFVMMFATKRYVRKSWAGTTWSFSEFAVFF